MSLYFCHNLLIILLGFACAANWDLLVNGLDDDNYARNGTKLDVVGRQHQNSISVSRGVFKQLPQPNPNQQPITTTRAPSPAPDVDNWMVELHNELVATGQIRIPINAPTIELQPGIRPPPSYSDFINRLNPSVHQPPPSGSSNIRSPNLPQGPPTGSVQPEIWNQYQQHQQGQWNQYQQHQQGQWNQYQQHQQGHWNQNPQHQQGHWNQYPQHQQGHWNQYHPEEWYQYHMYHPEQWNQYQLYQQGQWNQPPLYNPQQWNQYPQQQPLWNQPGGQQPQGEQIGQQQPPSSPESVQIIGEEPSTSAGGGRQPVRSPVRPPSPPVQVIGEGSSTSAGGGRQPVRSPERQIAAIIEQRRREEEYLYGNLPQGPRVIPTGSGPAGQLPGPSNVAPPPPPPRGKGRRIMEMVRRNQIRRFGVKVEHTLPLRKWQQKELANLYERENPEFAEAARQFKARNKRQGRRVKLSDVLINGLRDLYQLAHVSPYFINDNYGVEEYILEREFNSRNILIKKPENFHRKPQETYDAEFKKAKQDILDHFERQAQRQRGGRRSPLPDRQLPPPSPQPGQIIGAQQAMLGDGGRHGPSTSDAAGRGGHRPPPDAMLGDGGRHGPSTSAAVGRGGHRPPPDAMLRDGGRHGPSTSAAGRGGHHHPRHSSPKAGGSGAQSSSHWGGIISPSPPRSNPAELIPGPPNVVVPPAEGRRRRNRSGSSSRSLSTPGVSPRAKRTRRGPMGRRRKRNAQSA